MLGNTTKLTLAPDLRVETIDGEAIVLDRVGATLHRVTGDAAEALGLFSDGIDSADVPDHLAPAMAELLDIGVIVSSDWSRRKLLRMAGVGMAGAAITTVALASPAAAVSGTVTTNLRKTVNARHNSPTSDVCTTAATGNSVRGTAVWVRTESGSVTDSFGNTVSGPAICVTCEMTTGTKANGREIFILQSNGGTCVGGETTVHAIWPGNPTSGAADRGPTLICAPILDGRHDFVVLPGDWRRRLTRFSPSPCQPAGESARPDPSRRSS